MKNYIITIASLVSLMAGISEATLPTRYVQISTNSITQQSGGLNVSSGTIGTLYVTTLTATGIVGTTTNDSALTGNVGEYKESIVSAVNFPTSTQYGDFASITLSSGDWNVDIITEVANNGASVTVITVGISSTTGNSSAGLIAGSSTHQQYLSSAGINSGGGISNYRMSLTGSTIVYGKCKATYTVATPQMYGRISARRIR